MEGPLAALEASAFAGAMRNSLFLYPLANVLHVLGAMVFFAAVAAMDVRIIRAGELVVARPFLARLRPLAIAGFLLQLVTGFMLVAPEATHIAANPVFQVKLGLIVLGLLNVLVLEALLRTTYGRPTGGVRASAGASIALWLGVAAAGRLIAYF